MSDALLSPAVGGAMWAATVAVGSRCVAALRRAPDDRRVPLMGVMGAFVFAAQMVNFSIPGTGSSGHLGGGMLLAILLGPHAAFLVMASVLTIQALFFADGGLLALGCNVFNLAFFSSFIVYPLVYRPIAARAGASPTRNRVVLGAVAGSVAALALGATGVVLETTASGISTLPLGPFALLMVPLHLAIGVVEGLVTGTVVLVLWQARPELVGAVRSGRSLRPILVGLTAAVLLTGGVLSWFASQRPDGLEWSVAIASGGAEGAPSPVHAWLARIQGRTAILPDHDLAGAGKAQRQAWPAVSTGTSLSGLLGSTLVLGVAAAAGALIRRIRRR
jgi:cobalt/nickel transport system permease protein